MKNKDPLSGMSIVSNDDKWITIKISTRLPMRRIKPKKYPEHAKYSTAYIGLPKEVLEALNELAKKINKLRSGVIQEALDYYFIETDIGNVPFEPLREKERRNMVTIARTIRIDQDKKLRLLASSTGRSISELAREAIVRFLKMRCALK